MDPQLGMILCKLIDCKDQDSLKTHLLDVEAYQNGKPIEEVVTQKAMLERYLRIRIYSRLLFRGAETMQGGTVDQGDALVH